MLAQAGLVYRTLRHVPLRQLWFYVLRRGLPQRTSRTISPIVTDVTLLPLTLMAPLPAVEPVLRQGRFCFLNQVAGFGIDAPVWHAEGMPKLWRYHLHYFDWLKDAEPDHVRCAFTLDDWIVKNPPGREDAWEPYTVSLRLINWIGYCYRRQQQGLAVKANWISSIHQQGNWLARNLEHHIRANHLLKNRIALVWFALFCRTARAEGFLHRACSDLGAELLEQFCADGGHYERSPTYHAICLENCIALFDALQSAAVATPLLHTLRSVIERGLKFLRAMSFADGKVALVGDSTLHGGHAWQELQAYWHRVNPGTSNGVEETMPLQQFPDTGFLVWRQANCKMILSIAGPSPAYQPGHAHCDAGSFELEVNGQRVIVDAGVSQYASGPMRHYVRSSRAHNVMAVAEQDQNEIWGEFRIGARLIITSVEVKVQDEVVHITLDMRSHEASPIAYQHRRIIRLESQRIQILDTVMLDKPALMHSRLHIHPELEFKKCNGTWRVEGVTSASIGINIADQIRQQIESSHYCPDFGVVHSNQCLLLSKQCSQYGTLDFSISLQPDSAAVVP